MLTSVLSPTKLPNIQYLEVITVITSLTTSHGIFEIIFLSSPILNSTEGVILSKPRFNKEYAEYMFVILNE